MENERYLLNNDYLNFLRGKGVELNPVAALEDGPVRTSVHAKRKLLCFTERTHTTEFKHRISESSKRIERQSGHLRFLPSVMGQEMEWKLLKVTGQETRQVSNLCYGRRYSGLL